MRKTNPEPTMDDMLNVMAAFVMALCSQLPADFVDAMYLDLLETAEKMRKDGHEVASTLAIALGGSMHLPARAEQKDKQ
jgi:hypothetical protein